MPLPAAAKVLIFLFLMVTIHFFGYELLQLKTQNRLAFILFPFPVLFSSSLLWGPFPTNLSFCLVPLSCPLDVCQMFSSLCPVLLTYAQCSHLAVLSLTSWPYFHVFIVLSILACIYRPVTILWCPYRLVPAVLSLSSWPAVLTLPSYPVLTDCPVLTLPFLPYCTVPTALSLSPCLFSTVPIAWPCCPNLPLYPLCHHTITTKAYRC